jgi:hypothetical protein
MVKTNHQMETRFKFLNEIEGLEDFTNYAVSTDGNIWSFKNNKQKILKHSWRRKIGNDYYGKYVCLMNNKGKRKPFTIQRLVALAFIPTDDTNRKVRHINGDLNDNSVPNLEWTYPIPKRKQSEYKQTKVKVDNFIIEKDLLNKIKQVHTASILKGLPVPDTNTFLNSIVEGSLEEYIRQYGLRRFLT